MHSREIEKLFLRNEAGDSAEFSVRSHFHVNISKDAEGLSDVENEIYSAAGIDQAGGTFTGYHIEARDIELTGHINSLDKDRVRDLRHSLIHVLNPAQQLTLIYQHGEYMRKIKCRAESAPKFSADGIFQRFTLGLLCLDPFWTDTGETVDEAATWQGAMEFDSAGGLELTNSDSDPRWELGMRESSLIANIINKGDARTGMEITFTAGAAVKNPGIRNADTGEFIQINTTMAAGEILTVNTGYGVKSVKLTKESGTEDAWRLLNVDSTFLQLEPGSNPLRYYAETGEANLDVVIRHSNLYLGV